MGRVPDLPDVVRDQLEHIIPTSINALFSKNQQLVENGEDLKASILQYAVDDSI